MRSLLTALGVIIGVAALIITAATGEGAQAELLAQIASLGTNILIVDAGSNNRGGVQGGAGTGRPLTLSDLAQIIRVVPTIKLGAAVDDVNAQVVRNGSNWQTRINGAQADYFEIRDMHLASGRLFDAKDDEAGAKVCVLGKTVIDNLFGAQDPVGEIIRVKQMPCEVIGTLVAKGQSPTGQDQDDMLVMPHSTFKSRMLNQNRNYVHDMLLTVTSADDMAIAQKQVAGLLRQLHRLGDQDPDDFRIRNFADRASARKEMIDTQNSMLRSVAAVSLLVGGIGIMNIMLVSVTERTREIGLRLAIGAREREILLQFLIEAISLSGVGGLIGTAFGISVSVVLAHWMNWPLVINPFWILLACSVSVGIGVVFGFWPARRASRLDPIEALRAE